MIAIIDYGIGNLFSLKSSFSKIGEQAVVTSDKEVIAKADRIILPGVGAFEDAAKKLRAGGLDKVVLDEVSKGKPLIGICLGMQMLFERSYEYGVHEGLGLIKGEIKPLEGDVPSELKIPHMGWNKLDFVGEKDEIFKYLGDNDCVYFVHSYYGVECEEALIATAEYGKPITAAVRSGNVWGCQFHPEKSGNVGLSILKAFCEI
ncbi:MAG: imidazole glycerol phosphate synthase subunit HisH [Ruminococcaceae bacterium]|nr:imidazole glycerol phosphate synthase subunit HisH [Oscillospiraceae bacterium]